MSSAWAKFGRAAAGATAAAAATAAQPTAQARAPPPPQARASVPVPLPKVVDSAPDGWLLAEVHNTQVMFEPYSEQEVADAVNHVATLFATPASPCRALTSGRAATTIISEIGDETVAAPTVGTGGTTSPRSEDISEGMAADLAMEDAEVHAMHDRLVAAREVESRQLDSLLKITSRLLRRPGLQQEVVRCMLEDEEVRTLMLRESGDLDGYLEAVGIKPHISLLPPAAAAVAADGLHGHATAITSNRPRVTIQDITDAERRRQGPEDVVAKVAAAVAGWLDHVGHKLEHVGQKLNTTASFLGGWLRDRLEDVAAVLQGEQPPSAAARRSSREQQQHHAATATDEQQQEEEADAAAAAAAAGPQGRSSSRPQGRRAGDNVLGGVMMLAVIVVCVLIIRRPLRFRRAAW